MKKPSDTGYKNDCFYWELDVGAREFVKYQKKIYMFSSLASGVVGNKVFKGAAQRLGATKEQLTEVEHMLMDGTEIEIIKAATAEEIVEANKTWWQKFKEEFKNN